MTYSPPSRRNPCYRRGKSKQACSALWSTTRRFGDQISLYCIGGRRILHFTPLVLQHAFSFTCANHAPNVFKVNCTLDASTNQIPSMPVRTLPAALAHLVLWLKRTLPVCYTECVLEVPPCIALSLTPIILEIHFDSLCNFQLAPKQN